MKNIYTEIKILARPLNLFIGLFLGAFIVNKYSLNLLQGWKLEFNAIAIEYLKVLLSLPAILLVLLLIFFWKFQSAIDYFIRNLRVKYGDVEATSQQARNDETQNTSSVGENQSEVKSFSKNDAQALVDRTDSLKTENESQKQMINELRDLAIELINRSEFFEFKYLDKVLVLNTKYVLKDLNRLAPMTRDSLIRNIFVPDIVKDRVGEQVAIHNALLVNGLIEENGSVVTVSEKGGRYLKFIGFN